MAVLSANARYPVPTAVSTRRLDVRTSPPVVQPSRVSSNALVRPCAFGTRRPSVPTPARPPQLRRRGRAPGGRRPEAPERRPGLKAAGGVPGNAPRRRSHGGPTPLPPDKSVLQHTVKDAARRTGITKPATCPRSRQPRERRSPAGADTLARPSEATLTRISRYAGRGERVTKCRVARYASSGEVIVGRPGRWHVESRAKGLAVALRSRGRARPEQPHRRRTRIQSWMPEVERRESPSRCQGAIQVEMLASTVGCRHPVADDGVAVE